MTFIEIKFVARYLGVSTRRIRALLAQGRMLGYKNDRNIWMVDSSLQVRPGTRGPKLKRFAGTLPPVKRRNAGSGQASGKRVKR